MSVQLGAINQQISDITECSICTEVFQDPRVLPCVHTFCYHCLELFTKKKKPKSALPCPLCRKSFTVPNGGLKDLPKNHLVQRLIEINCSATPNSDVGKLTGDSMCQLIAQKTAVLQQCKNHLALNLEHLSEQVVNIECEIQQQQNLFKKLVDDSANCLFDQLRQIHKETRSAIQKEMKGVEDGLARLNDLGSRSTVESKSEPSVVGEQLRTINAELNIVEQDCRGMMNVVNIAFLPHAYPKETALNVIGEIEVSSQTASSFNSDRCQLRPQLVQTMVSDENADGVVGLSVINDLVYVVRSWSSKIEVFSSSLSTVQHQIVVPGLDLPNDMAGCTRHKCLYLTDYSSDVHRVDVGSAGSVGSHCKWSAGTGPMTVAVLESTASVLVTFQSVHKVKEFTTHGELLREISLPSDLQSPHHSVMLGHNKMLVCHGFESDSATGICLVDAATGGVLKSTDDSTVRFVQPVRLAVDESRSVVFVVDFKNDRIVILDMLSLSCMSVIKSVGRRPYAMFIDKVRGFMYVGSWETAQVSVYDVFAR